MLGNHQLLERRLRKRGKTAMATVVSYHRTLSMAESVQGGTPVPKSLCKVELRVEPDGESAFETTTEAWFVGTEGASEGMVVPVLYDPSDHSKLVVDHSDAAWKTADVDTMLARRAARRAAEGDDPAQTAAVGEMMSAAASDPEGFRKLMREQGPAAFGVNWGQPGSHPIGAPTSADPLDRLAKLAELHDRGALTDAEFQTQKEKLLGE